MIEKTQKKQGSQLWIMFVDYSKAFDTVAHNILWNMLIEFGTPYHLVWMMIRKLYESAEGVIRVDNGHTDSFKFEQGVRQGCLFSPMLFNVCGEAIMRTVAEKIGDRQGCIVGGQSIWNIRYADDTTLIAASKAELEKQAEELQCESLRFGLKINANKTQAMVINGNGEQPISVNGKKIKVVEEFEYLGSMIKDDGDSSHEIKARIANARNSVIQLTAFWKSADINRELKVGSASQKSDMEDLALWRRKLDFENK